MSEEAAERNWMVLKKYDKNLGVALEAQSNSPLGYGSEFRSAATLRPLLRLHPLWDRLERILQQGVDFPLEELPNDVRKRDLLEAIEFGNHKGAIKNSQLLEEKLRVEVEHGYQLVLPLMKVQQLEGALMAPMNIADQNTINERGEIIPSKRLTHNQSKEFGSGTSVNSRVQTDELQSCLYGHCLPRVIHYIVRLRQQHPNKRILLQKIDFKSAYRRAHLGWRTAIQTITQAVTMAIAFVALRLTFGGAPCPYEWSIVSETVTDLANALLVDENWDPQDLHAPIQSKIPPKKVLPEEIPFAEALPMIVEAEADGRGKADCYIDDITTVCVDEGKNEKRASAAVPLAIHILGRPLSESEPLLRKHLVSMSKLSAEAALEETKILLGWLLDTRRLLVHLPEDKYIAWTKQIKRILSAEWTTHKELESLIGRLTHLSVIVPHVKHFLSRLRHLMERAENRRGIKVAKVYADDLKLHLDFLAVARQGISMNLLVHRRPTRAYRSDACPAGIGGYSNKGRAWRWPLPKHLQFRATLNFLEFIASVIGPWIDIIEGDLEEFECFVSMTDSTTSDGWKRKTNFREEGESKEQATCKIEVARDHSRRIMNAKAKEYSQWFPGDENDVADSLSRDDHLSPSALTSLLRSCVPEQIPPLFEIAPLPKEIESWLSALLLRMPEATQSPERHQMSKLARGGGGASSSSESALNGTLSSMTGTRSCGSSSLELSPKPCERPGFLARMSSPLLRRRFEPPWTTWLRPSGTMIERTQDMTTGVRLHDFYRDNTRDIKISIQRRSNRKHCPDASSGRSSETSHAHEREQ